VSPDAFLAGYGAAQALPGPLFAIAAYLGALLPPPLAGARGAALALAAIFLPGLLLLGIVLPFWRTARSSPVMLGAMAGANAAVVGILAAALYNPVWTSAVSDMGDVVLITAGLVLLVIGRAPPIVIVLAGALFGLTRVA
jgi:chromate transporter